MNHHDIQSPRILTPIEGYTPHVGLLVASLDYARKKTMSIVADLSVYQLDHRQDERANSIGLLLLHMAAVEYNVQKTTFGEQPYPADIGEWDMPLQMGEPAWATVHGHPVEYYFEQMAGVREETLKSFKQVDDDWLWRQTGWWGGITVNHYWQWYHVFEDEMMHGGEINWLKSRIPAEE